MKEKQKSGRFSIIAGSVLGVTALALIAFVIVTVVKNPKPTIELTTKNVVNVLPGASATRTSDCTNLSTLLKDNCGIDISTDVLSKMSFDDSVLKTLETEAEAGSVTAERFHELTGYTFNAAKDKFGTQQSRDMGDNGTDTFTLGFTGDIGMMESDQSWYVKYHADRVSGGVLACIDEKFQEEMRNADIMMINNEFPYSDRGTANATKKYTFRAKPESVQYLTAMGVDLVSLANNHAYDYGHDAFVDTLSTLDDAGITYVGAGMNSEEANAPATFIVNGYKVGYIACSGVEDPIITPVADEDSEGVMGSYDGGVAVKEAIIKAKTECDYVIVYPHWGWENTTSLTDAQRTNSQQWIDAGADAIIGNHSHCLQGMDFYNGKFIAYSLGNFWFNSKNVYTGIIKLKIDKNGITPVFVPGKQFNSEATYISDPAAQRSLFDTIEGYPSFYGGVIIDDNGIITKKSA